MDIRERERRQMTTKKDLFLITGATGKTGAHTVRLLRQQGRSVRALVHTLDHRAERLAEQGAEVVQGDLLDFPSVSAATAGVTAAGVPTLLVVPGAAAAGPTTTAIPSIGHGTHQVSKQADRSPR